MRILQKISPILLLGSLVAGCTTSVPVPLVIATETPPLVTQKPRKAFIGVRARQTSVAFWADSWAQKIERVGTYSYPVDAQGNKLRGKLRVTVEINNDGSIITSQVDQSSGNRDL